MLEKSGGNTWRWVLAVAFAGVFASTLEADVFVFVEPGSEWSYFRGTEEPSPDDPAAWRQTDFDDGPWAVGPAPFGYGRDGPYATDLDTLDPPMRGSYTSLYLRRTFEVPDGNRVGELRLDYEIDDGLVVWINGVEAFRQNAGEPGEQLPFNAEAGRSVVRVLPETESFPNPEYFVTGTNVVAVQAINRSVNNGDFKVELSLRDVQSPDLNPPQVRLVIPGPGTIARRLDTVEVRFDEAVVGVDAGDLLVEGMPAQAVTGSGAGPYIFSFAPPAPGTALVEWSADAGITDDTPDRNAFAGGSWTYEYSPDAVGADILISEFMAANGNTLFDEDDEDVDWLELWNRGPFREDIGGWTITDNPAIPDKWTFPSTVLEPDGRVVVFASGKDRAVPEQELHTNFQLRSGGEYLGLFDNSRPPQLVQEYAPEYPAQRYDRSYGTDAAGGVGYFGEPTPGTAETGVTTAGFTQEPEYSHERGFYDSGFTLELTAEMDAEIYYTLDGSFPTPEDGLLYVEPLDVEGEPGAGVKFVRALAIKPGYLPSRTVTHSYLFPEHVLSQPARPEGFPTAWGTQSADYELNPVVIDPDRERALDGLRGMPSISIVTHVDHLFEKESGVYANPSLSGPDFERPVSAELIFGDGREGFQADCGIRTQGGSSTSGWKSRKVSLRLLFKGEYGPTRLRYPLYPDYPVDRFNTLVLDAGLNLTLNHPDHEQRIRTQIVRDQYVADLQNDAGGYAPRSIFVNLYLNGVHWGVYGLHERADAAWAAEVFGGDREDYDVLRHNLARLVDGSTESYSTMLERTREDLTIHENLLAVTDYLGLEQLAKYMMVNFYAGNTDWAAHNWYASRRRAPSAPYLYHSWDAEHVLKDPGEDVTTRSDPEGPTGVLQRLRANEDFRLIFADEVQKNFFSPDGLFWVDPESPAWNPDDPSRNRPAQLYMRRIEEVRSAVVLEYARWGDNWTEEATYVVDNWQTELDWLLDTYFPQRSEVVLAQFRGGGLYPDVDAPVFSHAGGEVNAGLGLGMSLPEGSTGTIYYTLDGSDPRVFGSGAVSPTASEYTSEVAINDVTVVQARTFGETEEGELQWSALTEAVFRLPTSLPETLLITEVMYNPALDSDTPVDIDAKDLEFIEIYNPTGATADLAGVEFTNGISFAFGEGDSIGPADYVVLASNEEAFASRYPDVPLAGVFRGSLANEGEQVTLRDAAGETVASVEYNDADFWPLGPDGLGYSLVLVDPADLDADPDDPRAWRASANLGGSPGQGDSEPTHHGVLINEVQVPPSGGIELRNMTDATVNVSGWYLSSDRGSVAELTRYAIAEVPAIPPGGYLVLGEEELGGGLELDPLGDRIFLAAADGAGDLTGYVIGAEYGPAAGSSSFGVHASSTDLEFVALREPTLGSANAPPRSPEVAISEIHYHPPDGESEFLELHNPGSSNVDLRGWKLEGVAGNGEDLVFPAGIGIEAGGYLVLVPGNPETFRLQHSVPAEAVVIGPYAGALSNAGERLRLWKPMDATGAVFSLVDTVRYNDNPPWPAQPDGDGSTLERIDSTQFGNEVLNWAASLNHGGTPGSANTVSDGGPPVADGAQVPGDFNQDRRLNVLDAILLLKHLSSGSSLAPPCGDGSLSDSSNTTLLDGDGSGRVDLSDGVHLLNFIFRSGPAHARGSHCLSLTGCPSACEVNA